MKRCLCCYKPILSDDADYHPLCAKRFFGSKDVPLLSFSHADINKMAQVVVQNRTTVTGIQAKLSLDIAHDSQGHPQRLTIVGVMGRYILKPQTEQFIALPEMEDLTMHLAEIAHIPTVPHALIRFTDGELNYITRRIDRTDDGAKLPMEDMCQLTDRMTEQKYQGSYELIASTIQRYSSASKLDVINFWEQVVFSWIVGNADMHLKNFSLISSIPGHYRLAPTYDQVSTAIIMPEDTEETALVLQGFNKKLMKSDFIHAMEDSGVDEKVIHRIISRFAKCRDSWFDFIDCSFITEVQKQKLKNLIDERLNRLS